MNLQQWHALGDDQLEADELAGCECLFALDLASKSDVCAYVKIFAKPVGTTTHFYAFCHCYLPEDATKQIGANAGAYARWARREWLTLTHGATIDYQVIIDDMLADVRKFNPREIIYDPWNATHFAQLLADQGVTMVEFLQRPQNFAVPMDDVLALVKDARLHHDNNEMFTWMIANTAVRPARKGLFSPMKEKPEQKIDGAVALIMGMSRMNVDDDEGMNNWLSGGLITA
jgi:phage terminase large subunit-like protein